MELPQPRPFGTEGRKTTHDFLSLYSPVQQDPRPPQAGGYLKTHDFLQPLEQAEKTTRKGETKVEVASVDKPPAPVVATPSVEHILPGGIGTYSISYLHQRVPKPEASLFSVAQASCADRNDENSNCSSYTGSGFTLWDKSAVKKGKTGKENSVDDRNVLREAGMNTGGVQPATSLEWQSQSSSNNKHNTTALSSLSSAQQLLPLKSQNFLHMITSAKNAQDDDDDEDFVIKKESQPHPRGNLSLNVNGKGNDQKPNTPRSKHSATEQRRRSKINDRFQMLRGIIPNSDQKRDKASFLLEVIEYIHFLQEKVHKYEESNQGWENEPLKLPLSKCHRTTQGVSNHPQGIINASGAALTYAGKFDENIMGISSTNPINVQKLEPNLSTASLKENGQQPGLTNKGTALPMQPNAFSFCGTSSTAAVYSSKLTADTDKLESKSHSQFSPSRSHMTDYAIPNANAKRQELSIESGTISISSAYSQGLLNTLREALQNSGVDLSQANISVQIDLGKRANGRVNSSASTIKGDNVSSSNQPIPKSIVTSTREESDHAFKRRKTS